MAMKTEAIQPAHVQFDDPAHGGTAFAPAFGDVYHSKAGAWAQAQHVFLAGNGLPQRWARRQTFTVLETGFGLGNNFLATWLAWREDPRRPARLIFISVEKHPLRAQDLQRALAFCPQPELAQALLSQWPPATHDLHCLDFDGGAVRLLLALGDVSTWLPELTGPVDAFFLDGFAPARNSQMWAPHVLAACGRLAAADATAATWSVARPVRDGLAAAGFIVERVPGFAGKAMMCRARRREMRHTHKAQAPVGRLAAPSCRTALVIGAGLAGASVARALAASGVKVTVLEEDPYPAGKTSGNPAGLFHSVVHAHDGAHAQLLRAGSHRTAQLLKPLLAQGLLAGSVQGLLRGFSEDAEESRPFADALEISQTLGLPPEEAQALDRGAATERAGIPLAGAAWLFPGSGWVSPPALVNYWLNSPGITVRCGVKVATIQPSSAETQLGGSATSVETNATGNLAVSGWRAFNQQGEEIAQADILVLANAQGAPELLKPWTDVDDWPLGQSRGQVSWWATEHASDLPRPHLPVASGGYVISLPERLPLGNAALPESMAGSVLCGATQQRGDFDPAIREADHLANLRRIEDLTGQTVRADVNLAGGRVGWRLFTDDRLPIIGAVPLPSAQRQGLPRQEQSRHIPRHLGLYVLMALGSRGIATAPLLGEVLAAWALGQPVPIAASLLDAVDAARFAARATRAVNRNAQK